MNTRKFIVFLIVILMGISTGCKKDELEKLRQENGGIFK